MTTSLFQYSVRTVVNSGAGSRVLLPEMIKGLGGKRAVLYVDKGITQAEITDKIKELFEAVPCAVQLVGVFEDIGQDAIPENINRGAKFFKECNGDALIAVGGGSVLDTVKAIKWMLHKKIHDIREVLDAGNILEFWPNAQYIPIPHVAIPTTAGSGAEVAPVAVVFNEKLKIKANILNTFINPDMVILDPELSVSLPPKLTASIGFDALTHAIEAYFSPQSNPMTDAYALQTIRLIVDNLPTAVHEGHNLDSRSNMLMASVMGISAFILSLNAVPVHNFAQVFGAKFGIPHGLGNAVFLPVVMESFAPFYLKRIHGFAEAIGLKDIPEKPEECLAEVVLFIRNLLEKVGLPRTFADFEVNVDNMAHIVASINSDPVGIFTRIPPEVIAKVSNEVAGSGLVIS